MTTQLSLDGPIRQKYARQNMTSHVSPLLFLPTATRRAPPFFSRHDKAKIWTTKYDLVYFTSPVFANGDTTSASVFLPPRNGKNMDGKI
jgi:hypothetical protein